MFDLPAERTPDRTDVIRTWVPRIAIGLFFLSVGSDKFSETQWVGTFAKIGLGDWFRHLTGALQIAGAVLLLLSRSSLMRFSSFWESPPADDPVDRGMTGGRAGPDRSSCRKGSAPMADEDVIPGWITARC